MQMRITDWLFAHVIYKTIIDSFIETFKVRKLKALVTEGAGASDIRYSTNPIDYKVWKLSDNDLKRLKHVILSKGEYRIIETKSGKWIIERIEKVNCLIEDAENTFLWYLLEFNK